MNKLALAAAVTALGAAASTAAYAGSQLQGPLLTGVALQSLTHNQPVITALTLASGESFDLPQVGDASLAR